MSNSQLRTHGRPAWMLAWVLVFAATTAEAGPQFRSDTARSGVYAGQVSRTEPKLAWKFPTGARVVSSPVVFEGTVYVGSDDGHLYAIDLVSGQQRWAYRTSGPIASSAAVTSDTVYVTSGDGRLHAIDRQSGVSRWKFNTAGERRFEVRAAHGQKPSTQTIADLYDVFISSPTVVNGLVYFGSGDTHIYAVDATSGSLRWKFQTGDVVHASPTVAGSSVFVGSWDGDFYALDAMTGRLRWKYAGGRDPVLHNQVGFQSSPAVVNGVVYTGSRDSNLHAIDAETGALRWKFSTGFSWVNSAPAVKDGNVYFATSDTALFFAVDAKTGKEKYRQSAKAMMFSSPALGGDAVVIGLLNGSLEARDLETGALLWTVQTDAAKRNAGWVLTADGRINAPFVYGSQWHDIPAQSIARLQSIGSVYSTPLVSGEYIVFGSADGHIYALKGA